MEDALNLCSSHRCFPTITKPSAHLHRPCILKTKPSIPRIGAALSSKSSTIHPQKPQLSTASGNGPSRLGFREKALYLESIGIDLFSVIQDCPSIVSSSVDDIKPILDLLLSLGFTLPEFRRICGMCPEILTCRVSDVVPVFTFLLREANVHIADIRRVINRRPRLLVSDVDTRLRPTLYFLQRLGIAEVHRYTSLLSCGVEEKFMPRMEYLEKMGFSHRDVISMVGRFPQMLCYGIESNLEPKFHYFVFEMGRDLKELKEFPRYFSFSLENRIRPRHRLCVERGVCFPLPLLLTTADGQFRRHLRVCCISSLPFKTSPLWSTNLNQFDV